MQAQDKKTDRQRRNFLRGAAATGAGAVIAVTAADVVAADIPAPNADRPAGKQAGYRLSQHVLDYYKTCVR